MTDAVVFWLERLIREACEDRLDSDPPNAGLREELMGKLNGVRSQIRRDDMMRLELLIERLTGAVGR